MTDPWARSPLDVLITTGPFVRGRPEDGYARAVMLFRKHDEVAIAGAVAIQLAVFPGEMLSWMDVTFDYLRDAARAQKPAKMDPRIADDQDLYLLAERFSKDLAPDMYKRQVVAMVRRDQKPGQYGILDNDALIELADQQAVAFLTARIKVLP